MSEPKSLTLKVYPSRKAKEDGEDPAIGKIKEPEFHEVEWADGLRENEGLVYAGDKLVESLWEKGDERIRQENRYRLAASIQIWEKIPTGTGYVSDEDDGRKVLHIWKSAEDRKANLKPYSIEIKEPTFEDMAFAAQKQEDHGTITAGDQLLERIAKDVMPQEVRDELRLRTAASTIAWTLIPVGYAEIEGELSGTGDTSPASAESTQKGKPSSGTTGKEEGLTQES